MGMVMAPSATGRRRAPEGLFSPVNRLPDIPVKWSCNSDNFTNRVIQHRKDHDKKIPGDSGLSCFFRDRREGKGSQCGAAGK